MAERCFGIGLSRALVKQSFRALTRARSTYWGICTRRKAKNPVLATSAWRGLEASNSHAHSLKVRHDPTVSRLADRGSIPTLSTTTASVGRGFSIIEVLVVIAIIAVLAALLFPVLISSRAAANRAKCMSNIKQLVMANRLYANDYDGRFVPAAVDIFEGSGGHWRWHGWRPTTDGSTQFDPQKSPLLPYMGRDQRLKECPLGGMLDKNGNAFEAGGGGYGYNATYIGGSYWKFGMTPRAAETTASLWMIKNPERTVMFTDAAMPQGYPQQRVTEYSFCEPPFAVDSRGVTKYRNMPSIHFRHNGFAVVAWCDGHVSTETMSFTIPKNVYKGDNKRFKVGWFGPDSNELFDLE